MDTNKSNIASFVSTMLSTHCYHSDWLKRIREDLESEETANCVGSNGFMKLLDEKTRLAVWGMCLRLNVSTDSVAPTACLVLERYLINKTRQTVEQINQEQNNADLVVNLNNQTLRRLPLLIACSVQLTCKMERMSSQRKLTAKKLQRVLMAKGYVYNISQIAAAEFEIFEAIGFKLPLWSSQDICQYLMRQCQLSGARLAMVGQLVELAELRRPTLQEKVAASFARVGASPLLSTLYLCGGVVAAAAKLFSNDFDAVPSIASLLVVPECFVHYISDVIIGLAMEPVSDSEASSSDSESIAGESGSPSDSSLD